MTLTNNGTEKPGQAPEGPVTLRLTVKDSSGNISDTKAYIIVRRASATIAHLDNFK